jgi:hypothetical protein
VDICGTQLRPERGDNTRTRTHSTQATQPNRAAPLLITLTCPTSLRYWPSRRHHRSSPAHAVHCPTHPSLPAAAACACEAAYGHSHPRTWCWHCQSVSGCVSEARPSAARNGRLTSCRVVNNSTPTCPPRGAQPTWLPAVHYIHVLMRFTASHHRRAGCKGGKKFHPDGSMLCLSLTAHRCPQHAHVSVLMPLIHSRQHRSCPLATTRNLPHLLC